MKCTWRSPESLPVYSIKIAMAAKTSKQEHDETTCKFAVALTWTTPEAEDHLDKLMHLLTPSQDWSDEQFPYCKQKQNKQDSWNT